MVVKGMEILIAEYNIHSSNDKMEKNTLLLDINY